MMGGGAGGLKMTVKSGEKMYSKKAISVIKITSV